MGAQDVGRNIKRSTGMCRKHKDVTLGIHKDVQSTARQEIPTVLGGCRIGVRVAEAPTV